MLPLPMYGRWIFAGLTLYLVWTLVRAWRSGVIVNNVWRFDVDDNPILFSLECASRVGLIVICTGVAAGYTMYQMFDFVGIGGLYNLFSAIDHAGDI